MSVNNLGTSICKHCGAEFRLFTIFNRDMQGLCKVWQRRHENGCSKRTPAQRLKWAKPYIGKDRVDSSIVVDINHPGFLTSGNGQDHHHGNAESWFDELLSIAVKHGNSNAIRDFDGWTHGWEEKSPSTAYYEEFPEHKEA